MERNMKLSLQCNLNCKWKTYPFKIKAAPCNYNQHNSKDAVFTLKMKVRHFQFVSHFLKFH